MPWLDCLDTPIETALSVFPENLTVAPITVGDTTYLVGKTALADMVTMQLGALPVKAIALPYADGQCLKQQAQAHIVKDVAHHLSDYFPNVFVAAIYELASLFSAYGVPAYIIGGITRDMLLNASKRFDIQDVDITIEGDAIAAAAFLISKSKNVELIQVYEAFGTAKLRYKNLINLDFASTRTEAYDQCGALPVVTAKGVPLEADILRRDFTINALALSVKQDAVVLDYTCGFAHLESQEIALLKPHSFFEDPSRILRGVNFAARLGFSWHAETLWALDQFLTYRPDCYLGGGDRIHREFNRLFALPEGPEKAKWIAFMIEKGLYRLIDSQLSKQFTEPFPLEPLSNLLTRCMVEGYTWWQPDYTSDCYWFWLFLGLPAESWAHALHRLGASRHGIDAMQKAAALLNDNPIAALSENATPSEVYHAFMPLPITARCFGVLLSGKIDQTLAQWQRFETRLSEIQPEATGSDIINLGVPQGEQVGTLLKALLDAKLDGVVTHYVEELAWLREQLTPTTELL